MMQAAHTLPRSSAAGKTVQRQGTVTESWGPFAANIYSQKYVSNTSGKNEFRSALQSRLWLRAVPLEWQCEMDAEESQNAWILLC
jgi:hypothetical protein